MIYRALEDQKSAEHPFLQANTSGVLDCVMFICSLGVILTFIIDERHLAFLHLVDRFAYMRYAFVVCEPP